MDLKTIIFIGRSGCGKGTQAQKIKDFFEKYDDKKFFHLEPGQKFRNFISEDSYTSSLAKQISEKGGLQPEFLSVWAWSSELIKNLDKHDHLIIDGTPRRLKEAHILETALDFYDRTSVDIIYLNISKEWAIEKMTSRGRADDLEIENVENRMKWFEESVVPILDYYRSHRHYNFHDINGEQPIDKVHLDIVDALGLKEYLDD